MLVQMPGNSWFSHNQDLLSIVIYSVTLTKTAFTVI